MNAFDTLKDRVAHLEAVVYDLPVSIPPCPFKVGDYVVDDYMSKTIQHYEVLETRWRNGQWDLRLRAHYKSSARDNDGASFTPASPMRIYGPPRKFEVGDWVRLQDTTDIKYVGQVTGYQSNGHVAYRYIGGFESWMPESCLDAYVPHPNERIVVVLKDGQRWKGTWEPPQVHDCYFYLRVTGFAVTMEKDKIDHIEPALEEEGR